MAKDWVKDAAEAIIERYGNEADINRAKDLAWIIAKHAPRRAKVEPGNIYDWATECAEYIHDEKLSTVAHTAAIVAHFAEPLVRLLQEARRSHSRGYNDEGCDYPPCPKSDEDAADDEKCTCTADEWNARVDAVLAGKTR